jgi:hypothetical protein
VKIRVQRTGVVKLSDAELRRMGFQAPERVRVFGYGGYLLSQRFDQLPAVDLPEVPTQRIGDGVLFYARGSVAWIPSTDLTSLVRERNFYSDYGYYFLTDSEEIPPTPFTPIQAPEQPDADLHLSTFDACVLHEEDAYSWGSSGRNLYEGYDYAAGGSRTYTLELPGVVPEGAGHLTVAFAARSIGTSTTCTVTVDDEQQGTLTLPGISTSNQYYTKATAGTLSAAWTGTKRERTTVGITHNRQAGTAGRLDYIALNYTRTLSLQAAPYLTFRSLASAGRTTTFRLSGATPATLVWDVTDPSHIQPVTGSYADGTLAFTIPAGTLREFVAVNPDASGFDAAESLGSVPNQDLHALEAADMVIIVPDRNDLLAQAERLAQAHRAHDGLTVSIVGATQVYNEFSSGTPDATAYRRLMKMLYDRYPAAGRPRYLLLFGDCSYDNRLLGTSWSTYRPEQFLLCYQSENSLEETASYITDDYFGFLDDDEGDNLAAATLDIGIGRFPVRTAAEARAAVDKTIAYLENRRTGAWKQTVCYVADDGDNNLHISQAEQLAAYTETHYPALLVNRLYADAYRREASATGYTYPDATKRLKQLFERGMLVVNYTGHGSTTAWAAENLLTAADVAALASPCLPLWITATCDFTRFDDIQTSAGELAFLNPNGGAIALFSTSRVVYASQNATLNQAFLRHVFERPDGQRLRLGDIMRLSKCDAALAGDRNKLNFTLIGDPALTLALPDYGIRVEEFAGVDVAQSPDHYPQAKAGGKITVRGSILLPDGTFAEGFDGTLHATVLDSRTPATTLNNNGEGSFDYTERGKMLFTGTDSVRNGRFEFTFPVPLDINYSDAEGLLSLYALEGATRTEAGGYFDRFIVGGTDDDIILNDTLGPRLSLYLNTFDFRAGGQTHSTPLFIARLEDPTGINTVGNGIGHDLTLCIDNSPLLTYSLNDYYLPTAGDYTRGTVRFAVPALETGKHTLSFRAWNLLNHSNTETLEFEVVHGLRPHLFSVSCTDSPARESTTFLLVHDRAGSAITVRLNVYDLAGRVMWTHLEENISAGDPHTVTWDLCSNNGQRLSPGVYIYRASIVSEGSKESVKGGKLIILRR